MSDLVVDASVAVKWLLPEVHAELAGRLLEANHVLRAPDLPFPEVGNALWKRVRRREVLAAEAAVAIQALAVAPLRVHATRPLLALALDVATRTGRSVYDGLYVAVALVAQARLVTADRKLYDALARGPLRASVAWLEDLA